MLNLEKMVQKNLVTKHRCKKNKFMDIKREGGDGINLETGIDLYTLVCIK